MSKKTLFLKKNIMKKTNPTNYFVLLLIIFSSLFLTSCENNTIESQIEELISLKNREKIKKIAYSLADSLDTKASNLLLQKYSNQNISKEKAIWSLQDMIVRYSEINDSRIVECISNITNPNPINSFRNEDRLKLIIYGLNLPNTNKKFKNILYNSALKHNKKGMLSLIESWKEDKDSKVFLDGIKVFEDKAIYYLGQFITKEKYTIDLLARIGEAAIPSMKQKMNSNSQSVRFAAGDVLVKMIEYHPNALSDLTTSINKQGIKKIADNYIFYIRLGQSGSENIILKALRYNFSYTMCLDLLNCGSSIIESGATEIARKNGYEVTSSIGSHSGPRWGGKK